ncbi:uncharacterized protein FOMMEDRAFT_23701 [Fomitiporia mediterranea MF3/22]|uniref:uncharacterized protein n=1 Tax=Fomitiporia mediterranea (strain MF3/22) TaxID=694068 RepID=UPI00044099B9|nr:uncharacterized protein FOMMEDRAFT_23701 [Fomitiporia mediterranea MF3/22]EJC98456.1 hypothetical protein FOMMEDRAFT_23701 [Fomitiporia mediterranea MF3/22]
MDDPLVFVPDIPAGELSLSANDPGSASAPIVVDLDDTNKSVSDASREELAHQRYAMKVHVPERERELDLENNLASAPTPNGIVDPRTLTRSVPSTATADEDLMNASRAPSINSATITATKTAPSASVFLRESDTSEANYSVLAPPELVQGTKGLANNRPPADETSSTTSRIFVEREDIPRSNSANDVNDNSVPRSGSRREDSAGANMDEGQGVNANSAPSTDTDVHIHTGAGSPPSPTAGPIEESTGMPKSNGMPEGKPPVHQIRWFNTEEWKGTFRRLVSGKQKTVTIDDLMNVDRTLAALEEMVSALASTGDDKDSVKALVEIVKEYLVMMKDLPDGFIPFDDQFGLRRRSAYLLQVAYGQK